MKPKAFVILAIVTAAVTVAALITVADRELGSGKDADLQPFPGLLDHVNEVAEISVELHDGGYAIKRAGNGWVMAERDGYPVQAEKVRQVAIGIGEMRFVEPKTEKPELFPRLDVENVDAEEADSKLVTLRDGDGNELARLIVGRHKSAGVGGTSGDMYVRLPGDNQSWLATGGFSIPDSPAEWLEKRIIHVNPKRIARVEIAQPEGETLVITRENPTDEHFQVQDVPEDAALKGEAAADDTDKILLALDLEDVKPQSKAGFDGQEVAVTTVETYDGLVVTVETFTEEGTSWARFSAEAKKVAPPEEAGEAAEHLKSFEEVKAEAEDINARLGEWAFALKSWRARQLTIRLSAFLQEEEPGPGMGRQMPPGMGGQMPPGMRGQMPPGMRGQMPPQRP